jgi:predicted small lipoprotein YifL
MRFIFLTISISVLFGCQQKGSEYIPQEDEVIQVEV